MSAFSIDKKKISVSAGGLPNLDDSTTFRHVYNFRYEMRMPKFDPTCVIFITVYTIDRTSNRVVTLGYSIINLFLNSYSMQPCTNPKDRETILMEGNYQLPIYIMDPRMMPTLRMDRVGFLEKIPCASLLVRIMHSPKGENGEVLSVRNVP